MCLLYLTDLELRIRSEEGREGLFGQEEEDLR